jgi:hypothetical protein
MNDVRPPTRLTSRALTAGSLTAAALLGVGFVLGFAGSSEFGDLVGNIGVIVLLATPVAGLFATWWELRLSRPIHARLAAAVLGVLVLATFVALLARP